MADSRSGFEQASEHRAHAPRAERTLPSPLAAPMRVAGRIAAIFAGVTALLGLIGWVAGVPRLESVIPGRPAMMPNSAVAIMVASLALWLLAPRSGGKGARTVGRAAAALVLAFGVAVLVEYAFGVDLGIDRVLVAALPHAAPLGPVASSGRSSFVTATSLALVGAALLSLDATARTRVHPAEILATAAALLANGVVIGHLYGARGLYIGTRSVGTAFHTALALGALALGVLLVRADRGIMACVASASLGGGVARRLLLAAIAFPPALGYLIFVANASGLLTTPVAYAALTVSVTLVCSALILHTAASLNTADAARRRVEERLAQLIEQASDSIFIADTEGRLTGVNAAGCALLGLPVEAIVGKTVFDFVAPDESPRAAEVKDTLLSRGGEYRGEFRLRYRDDTYIPVEITAKFLPDGRGQVFARDIRARKAAEAALARSHERERRLRAQLESLSTATAAITDAVARIPEADVGAVLQTVVLQAQAMTGARYAALGIGGDAGRPFDRWVFAGISPADAAAIGPTPRPVGLLGAVADGRSIRVGDLRSCPEHRGLPPGHPPMKSFLGVPIRYGGRSVGNLYLADKCGGEFTEDDERVIEMLATRAGTALETARLYGEETLAKTWLQGVVDGMPEGVLLAGSDGRFSYNAAALALARDDVEGQDLAGAPLRLDVRDTTGRRLDLGEMPLVRALRDGATLTGLELIVRDRAGRAVPVLASASPLRDRARHTVGAVCVFRDITALKQLEQLREEWTAIVAHDLRQPVGVISVSAYLLEKATTAASDVTTTTLVARIRAAAVRLNRMIGDLLDSTRIEAHRLALRCEPVDLGALMRELVDRMQHGERSARLHLEVPPRLPRVWADSGRVEQVLENLVSNALKYGTPGTLVELEASIRNDEVVVAVTNRGRQLSHDELSRVFTRFYRAPSATELEGLGLGLYITKGLVEAQGGRIWVDSTPEKTSFRFTLPSAELAAVAPRRTGTSDAG